MFHDLKYAARVLWKAPGFTVVAVIVLALGIGANTAIFSVVNAVLLKPLPFQDPDSLVVVWENNVSRNRPRNVASPANYLDWKSQNGVFTDMTAIAGWSVNLTGSGDPEELLGQAVTRNHFSILGVNPMLGRDFTEDEGNRGGPPAVILSHRLWQRRFGGDRSILNRQIVLNNTSTTVVGVMPPNLIPLSRGNVDFWIPMALDPARDYRATAGRYLIVIARLKPGVPLRQAQSELSAIAQRLEQQHADFNKNWGVNLVPLEEQLVGGVSTALWVLFGAVGAVLLIACGNLANLMLARAAAREKEIAIRTSLGAGRGRILRQLLTESLLLAACGGAAGFLVGSWGLDLLKAMAPSTLPGLDRIRIDPWVLAFTAAVSLITGLLFGLVPAWSATRSNLNDMLKEGGRGAAGGARGFRIRNALVVADVALSLVLLIGAGLLLQSLYRLRTVDPGFRTDKLMTFRVTRSGGEVPQRLAFFREAVERVQKIPGVTAASAVSFLPITSLVPGTSFEISGRPAPPPGQSPTTEVRIVHPDFFKTMGIALRRGRTFDASIDRPDAPLTFVINESMARQYFAGEDPLGKRISVSMQQQNPPGEIIGVVADNKSTGLDASIRPITYYSHSHFPFPMMTFVVRTTAEPQTVAKSMIVAIHEMDPNQPVSDVRTMEDVLSESVAQPRFQASLLALFAALALVLAAVGVYGVMSYSVGQRTREMGIRLVLGASPGGLLAMVIRQGLRLALIGLALGLAGGLALSRVLRTLLFEIQPTDPLTFGGVSALLVGVALLACYLPARRAARVAPMIALRYE